MEGLGKFQQVPDCPAKEPRLAMRHQHFCTQLPAPIIILSLSIILYLVILFPRTGRRFNSIHGPKSPTVPGGVVCGFIPFRDKISSLLKSNMLTGSFSPKTTDAK